MRVTRLCLTALSVASATFAVIAPMAASPAQAQATGSAFAKTKCQFTLPKSENQIEGKTYYCGIVTVPEDHNNPADKKTIQLPVAVFKSTASQPQADPVIYLDGGPGGASITNAAGNLSGFKPILDKRDLILFDQRGVGFSKPSLYCPETTKLDHDLLSVLLSPTDSATKYTEAALACQKRLVASGVNLSVYNSDQSAADVDAIRQALGYQMLNLYGISYGTRLALIAMRDFPAHIRSSIIDSVVPVEQPMLVGQIAGEERVFKQLWDGCAADPACNAAFPNLEKVFYQTVDRLNKHPVTFNNVPSLDSTDTKTYKVVVDGNALIGTVFGTFYLTNFIPQLPEIIYLASRGNVNAIAVLDVTFTDEDRTTSMGMYFSVNCQEDVAFETMAQINAAATGVPQELLDNQIPGLQGEFNICNAWGIKSAPAMDKQPVKSNIPTLVTAGAYDPVTPPSYSKQVADELGHAYFFEIPDSGHAATPNNACTFSLVTNFLNDPTQKPDGSCISQIGPPQFVTPGSGSGGQAPAPKATPTSSALSA